MRLHKTGHAIADTVSDLIGDLPDGDYRAAYGILRHDQFENGKWFELDKGFWGGAHYAGNYRLSFVGTQPRYDPTGPREPHGLTLEPWRTQEGYTLICPPTDHVWRFFGINPDQWLWNACRQAGPNYSIRHKRNAPPVKWDEVSKVITFNSTIGVEALRRGIEVISDPVHSTIGSFTESVKTTCDYNRNILFMLMQAHQFKLGEKEKICRLIKHYMSL